MKVMLVAPTLINDLQSTVDECRHLFTFEPLQSVHIERTDSAIPFMSVEGAIKKELTL